MAVDANFASLFENLKVEDPWIPPKTWESIPSESGLHSYSDASASSSNQPLYDLSTVSVSSLTSLLRLIDIATDLGVSCFWKCAL